MRIHVVQTPVLMEEHALTIQTTLLAIVCLVLRALDAKMLACVHHLHAFVEFAQ